MKSGRLAKGLLFDFDGTLYGNWKIWTSIIVQTLSEFHLLATPHDALARARSMIETDGESTGTLRISNIAASLARDHGVLEPDQIRARFFELLDERMDKTGPDQHLDRILQELINDGFQLGLVTFVRRPRIRRRLNVWNLANYFESVMTPDDEPEFKPSPQPFQRAMAQLQVRANDCFVIGDEPVDMIGGKQAGTTTVGLPQGFFSQRELEEAGADYIINSLNQLRQTVQKVTPSRVWLNKENE